MFINSILGTYLHWGVFLHNAPAWLFSEYVNFLYKNVEEVGRKVKKEKVVLSLGKRTRI